MTLEQLVAKVMQWSESYPPDTEVRIAHRDCRETEFPLWPVLQSWVYVSPPDEGEAPYIVLSSAEFQGEK